MEKLKLITLIIIVFTIGAWLGQETIPGGIFGTEIKTTDTTTIILDNTDLEIVKQDLITYKKLSPNTVDVLVTAIDSASRKNNIPVGLLHAIFRVESEYNFWIDHPKVTVTIKGTRKTVQAVGLGGVIWEFWSDSLAKHEIAQARSDLYIPEKNIQASAAILRWITDTKLKKSSTTEYNLINNIISGYYGAYDSQYHTKMMRITSDLWLKRIARILFMNERLPEVKDIVIHPLDSLEL